jgi:hypothetical protein
VRNELGFKAFYREVTGVDGTYALREEGDAYESNFAGENEVRPVTTNSHPVKMFAFSLMPNHSHASTRPSRFDEMKK